MKRMAKPPGRGNVVLEDAPIPQPGFGQVRVKAVRSLISRGSEIGWRYVREEAVDPQIMGYSMAGVIDALGEGVDHLAVGDRVCAVSPHAQFVVAAAIPERQAKIPEILPLSPNVTWDQAPYWMLSASAVRWTDIAPFEPGNVIVILGQGLIGSLILQVMRAIDAGTLIAVDATPLRCEIAATLRPTTSSTPPKKTLSRLSGRSATASARTWSYTPSADRPAPRPSSKAWTCSPMAARSTSSASTSINTCPSVPTPSRAAASSAATSAASGTPARPAAPSPFSSPAPSTPTA